MARVKAATGIRKPYSSRATLIAKAAKQVTLFERNMAMPELLNAVILSKIYIFYSTRAGNHGFTRNKPFKFPAQGNFY